jgi:hypothetical protein
MYCTTTGYTGLDILELDILDQLVKPPQKPPDILDMMNWTTTIRYTGPDMTGHDMTGLDILTTY